MAVMITVAAPFIGAIPAFATIRLDPGVDFPSTTTVGQSFTGQLIYGNSSSPPEGGPNDTLQRIAFIPSCFTDVTDCNALAGAGVEPGVFAVSGTSTATGGAFAGITFTFVEVAPVPYITNGTVTPQPGSGYYAVIPSVNPLPLPEGTTGTINFTVTTLRVPTHDFDPAPGVQTLAYTSATLVSATAGARLRNNGADIITVLAAPTTIATVAVPAGATVGTPVHDTAQVSGAVNPTGTVTFTLFSDAACTVAVPGSASTVAIQPNGTAVSGNVTPPNAGTYHWQATYSGDVNNLPAGPTACADPGETVTLARATPTIATVATPANPAIGGTATDTATVSGLVNPGAGGTVTFQFFSDPLCATPVGAGNVKPLVIGAGGTTGTATSDPFPVANAGTYHFVATYSGDANNAPAGPSACADPAETVTVARATPNITTLVTQPAVPLNGTATDTATVTGLVGPTNTGTVTFRFFSDPLCATQVGADNVKPLVIAAGGNGTATSDPFPVANAGTYHFTATYSGDVNNAPAGPTPCADPAEAVTVARAIPTIATVANPQAATSGTVLHDTATVSGLVRPLAGAQAGTVTFNLFSDPACATSVFTSTNPVDPVTGAATSGAFTVVTPGTYHWVASYSGDANNAPAGPTACADPAEQVVVAKASPAIATTATPGTANIGDALRDTATVTGGSSPTGTVTFTLYSNAACTTSVFTSTNALTPAGTATSDPAFTVPGAGTYHWVATYSGDANNNPAGPTACADPAEQVVVSMASPTIATTASPGVTVGAPVFDTATVSGGSSPTGTVTFNLYSDAACTVSVFTSTNPLDPATHIARSGNFTTTTPGTYHWVATYNGDVNNHPAGPTACADPAEQVVVGQGAPTIVTSASPAVPVGGQVTDTATVSGGSNPTGTVTFTLFSDAACATPPLLTSISPLNPATGTATSGPFTTTGPGTLHWVARYDGDVNNAPAGPTACADPAEQVVVSRTAPVITTAASSPVNVGGTVRDVATVTGLVAPTNAGTVTFQLYSDVNCATQVFTSTNPLDPATGRATSGAFTTTAAGTFHWVASYSGDANNGPAGPTACADPAEQVVVGPAGPSLVTAASPPVPVGGTISDTATLSGGVAPTGTITFTLFGPGNTTCTGTPLLTSVVPVNGNGNYPSQTFTTNAAGAYRWVAVYSGDANNAPAGPTACADPLETTSGLKVTPALVTTASAGVLGGSVSDTATLSNGFNPTGTIRFDLYGPNNNACTGTPIFTNTKPVTGNGNVTSDTFILPAAGTYHFTATYSGDANNNAVGPVGCADLSETVGVGRLPASVATVASGPVSVGGQISDTATMAGGTGNLAPTGTVTFNLYGPENATCTGTPAFVSVKPVNGTTVTSDPFTPTAPGTYRWVAVYSGDANNTPFTTSCSDPLEQVTVSALPTIAIDKTATPESLPVPGGTFTFNLVITNPGPVPVTVTALTDSIYGNVFALPAPAGATPCSSAQGTVLAANGGSFSCKFLGDFRGPSGAAQTDVVTVTGVDSRGNTVTAHDDARVTITPVPPTITTTKTATPSSLPEPGGTFTFSYSVTNTGPENVTVTRIVDDVYGDLNGRGTCAVGANLAPGASYNCTFQGSFFGNAGAAQTDTITTTAVDARGQTVMSQARATVTLTNVAPSIRIVKTPDPTSRPEPGGTFRFTVTVTNTSFEPITTTSLVDNVYGNLNGRGTCATGVVLAANGGTYTCAFDGTFFGKAGDAQTDTVTVVAVDNDNTSVTASAQATVTLTPAPRITTTKTVSPSTLPEPGGTFTFTYSVTNVGPVPVTVTSIVDDVYGNLNGRGTCAIGARLVTNATYTCTFTGSFFGNAGATQRDTITTTAVDERGNTVTSQASANVSLTNVPPTIQVVKTPDPTSRPEPGGSFRFTVTVTNTSFEPVTTTSLVDDVYGNLNGRGSCATGIVLAANGGSYSCAFDGTFFGKAGDAQTDTVTVVAVDNDNTPVTASARATVRLTPVGTTPVVQPPAPIVVTPPPAVQQTLVRTGSEAMRQVRLAGLFLLTGLSLIAATWRFGNGGPGLTPVPSGPDGGPGPGGGGGGFRFGDDGNWFGGARLQPPRGPMGGFGMALLPPAEPEVVDDDVDRVASAPRWAGPDSVAGPERVAAPEPAPPAAAAPGVVVAQVVVPEVIVPTVVQVRVTSGLDAAALDAANAAPHSPRPAPPRSGGRGRSRKFGGR